MSTDCIQSSKVLGDEPADRPAAARRGRAEAAPAPSASSVHLRSSVSWGLRVSCKPLEGRNQVVGVCLPHRWQPGLPAFKTPPSAIVLPPQGSTGYFSSVTVQPRAAGTGAYLGPHPGAGPWEEKTSSLESGPHSLGPGAGCSESPPGTRPLSRQCFSELIRDAVNKELTMPTPHNSGLPPCTLVRQTQIIKHVFILDQSTEQILAKQHTK